METRIQSAMARSPGAPAQEAQGCFESKNPRTRFKELFCEALTRPPGPPLPFSRGPEGGPADRKNFPASLPTTGPDGSEAGFLGGVAGAKTRGADPAPEVAQAPRESARERDEAPWFELPPEPRLSLELWERRLAQPVSRPVAAGFDSAPALALLRRCVSTGDGRSGRVRLELGEAAFEGSAVDLVYDGVRHELSVVVELGAHADPSVIEQLNSLKQRLLDRGLPLAGFQVSGGASEKPR